MNHWPGTEPARSAGLREHLDRVTTAVRAGTGLLQDAPRLAVALGLLAAIATATAATAGGPEAAHASLDLLLAACTALLVAAALSFIVMARATRRPTDSVAAWVGCGLLLLTGLGGLMTETWQAIGEPRGPWLLLVPLGAAVVHVGLDRAVPPARPRASAVVIGTMVGAAVSLAGLRMLPGPADFLWPLEAATCLAALTTVGWRCRRHPALPARLRTPVTLGLLTLAVDNALAAADLQGSWVVARAGVAVTGCTLLVLVAWSWAGEAGRGVVRRVDALVREASTMEETALQARIQLHDARVTLAGISAALVAISGADDVGEQVRFEQALRQEVEHLARQLGGERAAGTRARLDQVLRGVVARARQQGLAVTWDGAAVTVAACPDTVAEAVGNLLANCTAHAPGASVHVTTDIVADQVLLSVLDNGPGIPEQLRRHVLQPGVHRADSPGEGLGLASAARLARQAGGELRLLDTPRGTWAMLRLPAHREQPGP